MQRVVLCGALLTCGLAAQASLEAYTKIERPPLRGKLASVPLEIGDWIGRDKPVRPEVLKESQATDFLSRVYENRNDPGKRLELWINYSDEGLNLRHSPEVCLPSGGWSKIESASRELTVPYGGDKSLPMMRLAYSQGDLVQGIGFWYYIFGEGKLERYVRGLPITSRSSHGRTTRGSGMTVEIFCSGEIDPDGEVVKSFATALLDQIEPLLPDDRAEYFIP